MPAYSMLNHLKISRIWTAGKKGKDLEPEEYAGLVCLVEKLDTKYIMQSL